MQPEIISQTSIIEQTPITRKTLKCSHAISVPKENVYTPHMKQENSKKIIENILNKYRTENGDFKQSSGKFSKFTLKYKTYINKVFNNFASFYSNLYANIDNRVNSILMSKTYQIYRSYNTKYKVYYLPAFLLISLLSITGITGFKNIAEFSSLKLKNQLLDAAETFTKTNPTNTTLKMMATAYDSLIRKLWKIC